MNKKNVLTKVLFLVGMLFVATSAFAIPKGPCDQPPQDICCEEPPAGPFAFSYPKDIGLSCPRDAYGYAEFLWMKASEEGLDYAIKQESTAATDTFPLVNGDVKGFSTGSQEWDWRPGFRIGFGFYSNHDAWNFGIDWTYIRIKADSESQAPVVGTLLPLTLHAAVPATAFASARWSGDFNTGDLMMGKPYHVSRFFISNPMFGIRAAWIDQDFHTRNFIDHVKVNMYHKNDFWGVGLRAAYEAQFLVGSGFHIFAKAAAALLYGKFDLSQETDNLVIGETSSDYKTEDSYYTVKPNTEIAMGISWGKFFDKNKYLISLKIGYEFHQWWGMNQMKKFYTFPSETNTLGRGDLSFNGFSFGLNIDF